MITAVPRARFLEVINSVKFQSKSQQTDSKTYMHVQRMPNSQKNLEEVRRHILCDFKTSYEATYEDNVVCYKGLTMNTV